MYQKSIFEKRDEGIINYGLTDKFLEERIIFVNGEIDDVLAQDIIQQLLYLDSIGDDDITLYINTPGGCVVSGLAIVDIMETLRSDVVGVVIGSACSMGSILITHCDKRYITKHGEVMIHSVGSGQMGSVYDIKPNYERALRFNDMLLDMLVEKTKFTKEEIVDISQRDRYFSAEECIKYGIVDGIIGGR